MDQNGFRWWAHNTTDGKGRLAYTCYHCWDGGIYAVGNLGVPGTISVWLISMEGEDADQGEVRAGS